MTSQILVVFCLILATTYVIAEEEVHSRIRRATYTVDEVTDLCNTTGCFLSPPSCVGTACDYAVAWEENGNNVDFKMAVKVASASYTNGFYGAIAFSNDDEMGQDSVISCLYPGSGSVSIEASWNPLQSNSVLDQSTLGLSGTDGVYANGYLSCTFSRLQAPSASGGDVGKIFDISAGNDYYLLVAVGPLSGVGSISYHGGTKVRSGSKIDYTVSATVGGEEEAPSALLKLHGICMVLAWILFATIGITNARYFKNQWPDKKPGDKALWFWFHQSCMVLAVTLTIIGFIAIFVEEGDFSSDLLQNPSLLLRGHPIIGIIVPAFAIINPIMAFFRPHPGTSKRPIFNWFHRVVGTVGLILGVLNVFIGLQLEHAESLTYAWTTWMLIGWVVFHFIIELTLMCCLRRPAMMGTNAMEMKGPGENSGLSGGGGSGACCSFGTVVLFFYALVTLIVSLVVVIPIAVGTEALPLE